MSFGNGKESNLQKFVVIQYIEDSYINCRDAELLTRL